MLTFELFNGWKDFPVLLVKLASLSWRRFSPGNERILTGAHGGVEYIFIEDIVWNIFKLGMRGLG